jgi:putative FmdB family regulatory protein
MPTYSYQCKRCNHIQDIFHGISASPSVKCEVCGKPCTKLLGTGAGIIFKGSGFYETDYKRKGKPSGSDSHSHSGESKSSSDKPAKAASTGDSKPAAAAKSG